MILQQSEIKFLSAASGGSENFDFDNLPVGGHMALIITHDAVTADWEMTLSTSHQAFGGYKRIIKHSIAMPVTDYTAFVKFPILSPSMRIMIKNISGAVRSLYVDILIYSAEVGAGQQYMYQIVNLMSAITPGSFLTSDIIRIPSPGQIIFIAFTSHDVPGEIWVRPDPTAGNFEILLDTWIVGQHGKYLTLPACNESITLRLKNTDGALTANMNIFAFWNGSFSA
jgi:hypothetical protein